MFFVSYLSFLLLFLFSCTTEIKQVATDESSIEKAPENGNIVVAPEVEPEVVIPPFGGPDRFPEKPGNSDGENCTLTNPDSDLDGVCDDQDKCPGFNDMIDKDRDGSPYPCDCDDNNPAVKPGLPCTDDGTLASCYVNICDANLSGTCILTPEREGKICPGALEGPCDAINTCDGDGHCIDNKKGSDFVCRKKANECQLDATCDGEENSCPENGFTDSGSSCGINNSGECDGSGHCDRAFYCPGATNTIDNDGDNYLQQCDCDDNNPYIYPGQPCASDSNDCTNDICDTNLSGQCVHQPLESGTACGGSPSGDCEQQSTCDGEGRCDANLSPNTYICRPAEFECDNTEFCDGVNPSCPPDTFAPEGTICGDAVSGICDRPDTCNGFGVCDANFAPPTEICHRKKDACDETEFCTGSSATCPPDEYATFGTPCGSPPSGLCDAQDICDGSGTCLAEVEPAGTVCRASAGLCDLEEDCDGVSPNCPPDIFVDNGPTNTTCSSTGYSGSCANGIIICQNGDEICYPNQIECTEFVIYGEKDDLVGQSVGVDNGESILGAYGTHDQSLLNSDNRGSSYLPFLSTSPNTWSRGPQIFPVGQDDEIGRGEFGKSVAISGNSAIIGAPRTDSADFGINTQATGRVYFFNKNTQGQWNFSTFFDDPEENGIQTSGAFFGTSVDMSLPWAIAGGPGIRSQFSNLLQGAAQLFFLTPESNTWEENLLIFPAPSIFNTVQSFGTAVAIDGDWVAISAPASNLAFLPQNGVGTVSFYFNDPSAGWTNVQTVSGTQNTIAGFFGSDIDISGDLTIVGDMLATQNIANSPIGAASIYRLNGMSNTWDLEQVIFNPYQSNDPNNICDFGISVAIHKNIALIGADNLCGSVNTNGVVYVYQYNGSSWQFRETLTDPNAQSGSLIAGPQFGSSVAIDDNTIVVGSVNGEQNDSDHNDSGSAYFYYYPQ